MAYVLIRDQVERTTRTSQLAAVLAATQGAQVDVPELDEAWDRLDAWLASPLEVPEEDREQVALEAALGVGGR